MRISSVVRICRSWRPRTERLDATSGRAGRHGLRPVASGNERVLWAQRSLHLVVAGILADVADIENDGLFSEVLPPMRGTGHFRPDIAGLVRDRHLTIAGIFDDLALLHEDQRGPVVMAMPGHDAAGLDGELAEAQLAALDMGGLLAEIDGTERDVAEADRLGVDHGANVGFHLIGGAFARNRGRRDNHRSGDRDGKGKDSCACILLGHDWSPMSEPHRRSMFGLKSPSLKTRAR